ncbi:MAG TPA: hypothetical protein VFU76_11190 [Terriglobales bacterium]|nr:hypothetical protein [Terriglobales bacterium]
MQLMFPTFLVLLLNGLLCLVLLLLRGPDAALLIASLTSTLAGFVGLVACGLRRLTTRA